MKRPATARPPLAGAAIKHPAAMTRRDFLWLTALSVVGAALPACAVNPVTGQSQLMLVSEQQEIQLDRQSSPHQLSADLGPVQDDGLNWYVNKVGTEVARTSHRPDVPYSFRAVNATYVNAYAFPGGTIACTRGILLALKNESELAALLGHEIGHVNARHTAARMSQGVLISGLLGGAASMAGGGAVGGLAQGLAGVGAGLILASYSREDERQADELGMEYMVRTGYTPAGMVGLMEVLRGLNKSEPSAIEVMFSTHPMSEERYQTAVQRMQSQYRGAMNLPDFRERYMDSTASVRRLEGPIKAMQDGDREMGKQNYAGAEGHYRSALRAAPGDYAGLVKMARCRMAQKDYNDSVRYAEDAQRAYPGEAQAYAVCAVSRIARKDYDGAHAELEAYDRTLPGNPSITFLKGYCQEGMGRRDPAAQEYRKYLGVVREGEQAQYAYKRLVEWGYVKPTQ